VEIHKPAIFVPYFYSVQSFLDFIVQALAFVMTRNLCFS